MVLTFFGQNWRASQLHPTTYQSQKPRDPWRGQNRVGGGDEAIPMCCQTLVKSCPRGLKAALVLAPVKALCCGGRCPREAPSPQDLEVTGRFKSTHSVPAGVASSSKCIDAAARPLGRRHQQRAQPGRGGAAAAAACHQRTAQGYEGMVAGGQGPGSWAAARACL